MALGLGLLVIGQIWVAPVVFTLGLGLLLRVWAFQNHNADVGGRADLHAYSNADDHYLEKIAAGGSKRPAANQETYTILVRNLPLSRMVVVIIILTLAFIDAAVFRTPIVDRYNPIGSWQILMGPTLFYPMVFLPLIMGVGLILHLIFTIRSITLTRIGDMITIQERGVLRLTNRINLALVTDPHFRSNSTGLKALWLIPWSIQIWGNFASAWHYLTNEFTFGTGLFIGPAYLVHAVIYFLVLLLLLFAPEIEMGWETPSQECYLRWYPRRLRSGISFEELAPFLHVDWRPQQKINFLQQKPGPELQSALDSRDNRKNMHFYLYLGVFLFILPFVSIAIPFFFNDAVRICIFLGAMASFGVALKDHAVKPPNRNPFGYIHYKPPHMQPPMPHRPSHPTPLGIMLYLSEWAQILSIGVILTIKWRLYPILTSGSWVIWADLLASTVLGILMVWFYLKRQWDILGECNRGVQVGGLTCLAVGIVLSFLL
jgi:hypothetical protein